ncbi:MoaD/ThiS family protein [Arthrobacter sp.]|uniref:MoaD/ThiS family protein n=1 Tax=Arthrobacter sp. TaxID=1667 RepID=UPI0028117654|nr:MoaD/ThiS family protein [Arthrobacter sp.]
MNVRYFAAARAAAGVEEERFELPAGSSVKDLLAAVLEVERPEPPAGTPPLARLLSRSSFLLNEVAVRDRSVVVGPDDVVDVLPPFAGG